MITGKLRQDVDRLWEEFWTGGITNPLTVIEQVSFLMFSRMLDIRENLNERKAKRLKGKTHVKMIFGPDQQHLRWNHFKDKPGAEMLKIVREEVFPHFRTVGNSGSTFSEYMADAQCLIQKPSLLVSAVGMVDRLPIEESDTKGDLYEYLLSKLTTAGINGQFRTPRHIIRMMVGIIAPKPTDIIGDPACGTGGFLAAALDYIFRTNTSKAGIIEREDEEGNKTTICTGDKLNPDERRHVQDGMFFGFDFDVTMLRIASMNLILHGLDNPNIHYCDTLANSMPERFPELAQDHFDVILANPPFKGSLDYSDVHSSLTGKVKTKKTELLFIALMLRMLKTGGRCAVIVPDGVLFGSSTAHRSLRQMLVDDNQLEAVISLPAGVFKPYAGVSTAVLVFAKGGRTDNVFYYDVERDGYSLDDKRTPLPENDKDGRPNDDLPDVVVKWKLWNGGRGKKQFGDHKARAFFVPRDDIASQDYDLSIGRYREHVYEEAKHDLPMVILGRLKGLEQEIAGDIKKLEGMLDTMTTTSNGNWRHGSLAEVATIDRRALSPSDIKDGTLYVGLEHLDSSGRFLDVRPVQSGDLASTKFQFTPNHILYGKLRPYLAKIVRPAFSGVCSTDILPIKPGPAIDKNFLYYYLRQPQMVELATAQCSGANLPRLSPRHLAEFQVPLPSLSEQKRIAAILDQSDAIHRKRHQASEITREMIPAIFDDRFGNYPEDEGHVVVELGECSEIVSGVTKGRRFNGQMTLMLPYLRVANVQDGRLDLSEIKTVEALPSDLEKCRLQAGDVLLTEGGDYDKLGRGALWEGQIEDCIHQNHIFRVRADRTKLLPVFFANYLQTVFAKAYFLRCAKKTTNLATINMRQLRVCPVPLPPISEQQEFLEEVDVVSGLSQKSAAAYSESNEMFASLVQRAYRGEL